MKGTSNRRKADREQPEAERRVRNFCEYIPKPRTERSTSRLRRVDGRYQRQGMTVPAEAACCEAAVNLGGNTEVELSSYVLG